MFVSHGLISIVNFRENCLLFVSAKYSHIHSTAVNIMIVTMTLLLLIISMIIALHMKLFEDVKGHALFLQTH